MSDIDPRDFGALEAKVEALGEALKAHQASSAAAAATQSAKIDELLALANKGRGVFWLATLIAGGFGSGLTVFLKYVFTTR